jgi:hypothetical protein
MKSLKFSCLLGITLALGAACVPAEESEGLELKEPATEPSDPNEPVEPIAVHLEVWCDGSCALPCGTAACVPRPHEGTMPVEEWINGFVLVNYEYWPYGNGNPSYPDDIGWGFWAGSEPAQACMAEAYYVIRDILQDPPQELLDLKEKHDVYAFFQCNNDYTGASRDEMAPDDYRALWLYNSNLIKWISETNIDGRCVLPTRQDLVKFATGCMTSFPNCDAE